MALVNPSTLRIEKLCWVCFLAITALSFTALKAQQHLNTQLIYNWKDTAIAGSSFYDNAYNEVWGFVQNGKEYAVIGSTEGTHIFDVTDVNSIVKVEFIPGNDNGPQIIHRDYHDYAGYLYMVSDEGQSTLQIADLSYLPDSAPIVYSSNALFSRAHNIFIDTANARLYTCGGNTPFSVYSLQNPTQPRKLLNCQVDVPFWNQIGYVHDTYVVDNVAYCNAEGRGLFVVDFTDTADVKVLGSLSAYPDKGYNHSGWLNADKTIYAMADETWGMAIKILDVSDLNDIKVLSTIASDVNVDFSIVHNLIIVGDKLYVSHYYDGMYVFDISDPANPSVAGYYDTSTKTHRRSYEGCWGVYPFFGSGKILASDMQEGLFVLDARIATATPSIIEEQGNAPQFYPNPMLDIGFIELPFNGNIKIQNSLGAEVASYFLEAGSHYIDLSSHPSGLYIISCQGNNENHTLKIIKH